MKITDTFIELGKRLQKLLTIDSANLNGDAVEYEKFKKVINRAAIENKWFTEANILKAFDGIVLLLDKTELEKFYSNYASQNKTSEPKRVGVIFAGNIPLVGFHDLMCVLLSGNKLVAKLSSDDTALMTYIIEQLISINSDLNERITIAARLNDIDAVIATGSNNSSRYFEYYFGKYPHIIRKNRNAIAVIDGTETNEELNLLGADVFSYFGLGCRNVSKLYVPVGYNFNLFFENIQSFAMALNDHNKYLNNFEYHRALFLLEQIPFLTNNYLIIKEGEAIATPVSVVNYEFYNDAEDLKEKLLPLADKIQCVVSKNKLDWDDFSYRSFYFGEAQKPSISDFADGVDTMAFLTGLHSIPKSN